MQRQIPISGLGTGIEFCPPAGGLISLPKKFPRVEVSRLPALPADAGREAEKAMTDAGYVASFIRHEPGKAPFIAALR